MNVLELSEQEIVRRQSLQELRRLGIDPYPAAEFPTNAFSTDIKSEFNENEKREVVIAGRLMGRRVMGKASFAEIQDSKGRIQVYVTRDDLCPGENKDTYNVLFKKLLDTTIEEFEATACRKVQGRGGLRQVRRPRAALSPSLR